ncbi:unnamed protein product [Diatraea saccharalis]|uniref:Enoyl reductase (ER) domain-containing protein n=1 Tax=Diatraea saccharalis TaxID=40085 RepID=A0A9N9R6H3_9NEOP|nr:unnamed protein product [Diatraea saccharalis]
MKIEDAIRANLQLVLENIQTFKVKTIEYVDEEYKKNNLEPIITTVAEVLEDMPLTQADLLVISEKTYENLSTNITVENKSLSGESNAVIFIGANLLKRDNVLQKGITTLREKCFIISREKERPDPNPCSDKYDIVSIHDTGMEYIILLRKKVKTKPAKFVKITADDLSFSWIDKVKEVLIKSEKVVLYSEKEHINGLLGLVNCLRREPGGEIVCGMLIADSSAPLFNPDLEIYEKQLNKDLSINIFQDGQWGTYRHLLLGDLDIVRVYHAFINTTTIGDLSSLRWLEGPIKPGQVFKNPDSVMIHVMIGQLQHGESILIHAGSGGVGQAAINVALHYGCEVFTTVGNAEKRAFIKKLFPQLKDSHIGNSRDTSFEDMIHRETKGKGVDMVLNSLSDEKLHASMRCLCYRGRFLEIGVFDINNNTAINMYCFRKEISFHGIMLNYIFDQSDDLKQRLQNLLLFGIESGAVRPLTYCTFEKNQVESAFRYMAAGKHIGKVIIARKLKLF